MGLIANSKHGDCSRCPATNTAVRKRCKDLVCIRCCRNEDVAKQMGKLKARTLVAYQTESGIMDSIQGLVTDLDIVVSKLVRITAIEKDGKVPCFTCKSRLVYTNIQCGHFIPRANMAFRFDWYYNLRPQCPTCNCIKHGNLKVFEENLEKERPGITEWMKEEARKVYSPSRDELKQMLFDCRKKLLIIEKSKLQ